MYKTEDYGLFLGLLTMPFGKEREFKQYEIDNLFEQYKERVASFLLKDAPEEDRIFSEMLFRPKVYCLFGKFDLAVLSLADSFGLATRSFHPFSPLIKDKLEAANRDKAPQDRYQPQNYTFHVVSSLVPDLRVMDEQEASLLERAGATFLNTDKQTASPFIGISSFKFNNALITGGGGELVDLAVRAIRNGLADRQRNGNGKFHYLISYSFSWHELSVIFFSDSYQEIVEEVFKLRELAVADLLKEAVGAAQVERCRRILPDTLLYRQLQQDGEDLDQLNTAHLFVHSNTTLGYDSDIFIENDTAYDHLFDKELSFRMRWEMKPGHLSAFLEDLKTHTDNEVAGRILAQGRVTTGRGDYAYLLEEKAMANFRSMMKLIVETDLRKHIRTLTTVPEFKGLKHVLGEAVDLGQHYLVHDELARYQFQLRDIVHLRACLNKLRIPKIIQEKVNNMYTIYNDGISDPVLYGYFIELRPYLEEVMNLLEALSLEENPGTVNELTERFNAVTHDFEMAYLNRFGQSYLMNEITDYNLMFNGGIQQLVSLFDGAYKSLTSLFGEGGAGRSMAYVAGISNTKSELLSVRLNYFHLYQPEFFAATATHEAANFTLHRFVTDETPSSGTLMELFELLNDQTIEEREREHLNYFLVDILTFYTTFAENFELFFYWRWSVYLQMSIAYNTDGSFNEDLFEMLFTRMYLLADATGNEAAFRGMFSAPFGSADRHVDDAWERAWYVAEERVALLYREYTDVMKDVRDLAVAYLQKELIAGGEPADYTDYENLFLQPEDRIKYESDQLETVLTRTRQAEIQQLADRIQVKFEQGEVFSIEAARKTPKLRYALDAFFLQALLLAYLQVIKKLCKDEINILPRSGHDGKISRAAMQAMMGGRSGTSSQMWFDPHGGMFTTDTATRVAYFKYRTVFLKSLWNFSAKRKCRLFEEV